MFVAINDARFWYRAARKYPADPIADEEGYERTIERTQDFLGSDQFAFKFGCGTGTTARRLAHSVARIAATDISGEMIDIARKSRRRKAAAISNYRSQHLTQHRGRMKPSMSPWASMSCIWWP